MQVTHRLYLHIHCEPQWWDHFSITDTCMTLHPLTWEFTEEECSRPPQRNVGRWCFSTVSPKGAMKTLHSCRSLFLECGNKPSIFQKVKNVMLTEKKAIEVLTFTTSLKQKHLFYVLKEMCTVAFCRRPLEWLLLYGLTMCQCNIANQILNRTPYCFT